MTTTVALYARVSRASKNGRTVSVDQQLAELRTIAADHGLTIAHEFTDRAIKASGAAKSRPGWEALLQVVDRREVTHVGLWETSRGSRRLVEFAEFIDLCAARGVRIVTPDGILNPASTADRAHAGHEAVGSEKETATLSDRSRRSIRLKAAEGWVHGRDRYGYLRHYDELTGTLMRIDVHPEEGPVVRSIVDRALAGTTITRIVRDLNDAGLPAPTDAVAIRRGREPRGLRWTHRIVRDIVLHPAYAGIRVHKSTDRYDDTKVTVAEHRAVWPAIVTPEEHATLQATINAPERRQAPGSNRVVRWTAGTLRCSECGGKLRHKEGNYQCGHRGCGKVFASMAGVDSLIEELVIARLDQPDAAPGFVDDAPDRTIELRATIEDLQRQLDALVTEVVEVRMSPGMAARMEAGLQARLDAANADLRAATAPALPEWARDATGHAAASWEAWSTADRHAVTRALLTAVFIRPSGKTGRPARGQRPVSPARLGAQWAGSPDVVWLAE